MDGFQKNDSMSLQKDILNHVEYTVARSRFSFDDFEAYQVIRVATFFFKLFSFYAAQFVICPIWREK